MEQVQTRPVFDAGLVRSGQVRALLDSVLGELSFERREGLWALALAGLEPRLVEGELPLLVGDLHVFNSRTTPDMHCLAGRHLSAVLLVRSTADEKVRASVDFSMRLPDGRLVLADARSWRDSEAGRREALGYFRTFLEWRRPERVTDLRYSEQDAVMWVRFGDGLERAVPWGKLPFAGSEGNAPAAVRVGDHGHSVVMLGRDGEQLDVSAGSLRAALDDSFRKSLLEEDVRQRREMGERFRRIREERGFSQVQLSRLSGIPQESLSRLETGRNDPRLATLRKLAAGLGLSIEQLLDRLAGT